MTVHNIKIHKLELSTKIRIKCVIFCVCCVCMPNAYLEKFSAAILILWNCFFILAVYGVALRLFHVNAVMFWTSEIVWRDSRAVVNIYACCLCFVRWCFVRQPEIQSPKRSKNLRFQTLGFRLKFRLLYKYMRWHLKETKKNHREKKGH